MIFIAILLITLNTISCNLENKVENEVEIKDNTLSDSDNSKNNKDEPKIFNEIEYIYKVNKIKLKFQLNGNNEYLIKLSGNYATKFGFNDIPYFAIENYSNLEINNSDSISHSTYSNELFIENEYENQIIVIKYDILMDLLIIDELTIYINSETNKLIGYDFKNTNQLDLEYLILDDLNVSYSIENYNKRQLILLKSYYSHHNINEKDYQLENNSNIFPIISKYYTKDKFIKYSKYFYDNKNEYNRSSSQEYNTIINTYPGLIKMYSYGPLNYGMCRFSDGEDGILGTDDDIPCQYSIFKYNENMKIDLIYVYEIGESEGEDNKYNTEDDLPTNINTFFYNNDILSKAYNYYIWYSLGYDGVYGYNDIPYRYYTFTISNNKILKLTTYSKYSWDFEYLQNASGDDKVFNTDDDPIYSERNFSYNENGHENYIFTYDSQGRIISMKYKMPFYNDIVDVIFEY